MTLVRRAHDDDAPAVNRLGCEAFGYPYDPQQIDPAVTPGQHRWICETDTGAVAGTAVDHERASWFGGRTVSTCALASVAIPPEHRGQGMLAPLLMELFQGARERGTAIATLYPTAPGIYRRFGCESIAEFTTLSLPTSALAQVRAPHTVARLTTADAPVAVERVDQAEASQISAEVYSQWAQRHHGPLMRVPEPAQPAGQEVLSSVTVARDEEGRAQGIMEWSRSNGYMEDGVLRVTELMALTPQALVALLRQCGTHNSVAPRTRINTSGRHELTWCLPSLSVRVERALPYMLTVLDVPAAWAQRGFALNETPALRFRVTGLPLSPSEQNYVLSIKDGRGQVEAEGTSLVDAHHFSAAGLALMYAGAATCEELRWAGHLIGGQPEHDHWWDSAHGGRAVHIRDYF